MPAKYIFQSFLVDSPLHHDEEIAPVRCPQEDSIPQTTDVALDKLLSLATRHAHHEAQRDSQLLRLSGVQTELRDYQQQSVAWMITQERQPLGMATHFYTRVILPNGVEFYYSMYVARVAYFLCGSTFSQCV